MEGGHYVMSELTIQGDIDSTSIEYQAVLFPPFLTMQAFASVQLFQGSNNCIFPVSAVMDPFQELGSLPLKGDLGGAVSVCHYGLTRFSLVWLGSTWLSFEIFGRKHHLVPIVFISHPVVCLV